MKIVKVVGLTVLALAAAYAIYWYWYNLPGNHPTAGK